ncbi:Retrovirus-related Pol polyprotein from transposon TNT 1-94 [Vitis vinifera]|uniref:Retrovirus-related Pol polyprotein from transposon TNT 1-94 n=1 Tax=Vitis vinifera TaxID=29760 RepID=A0A438C5F6_VITVI|nr:Retrovirus-related Pol polyprotein from transposon TNT 1-94 [Vitis vinifera]
MENSKPISIPLARHFRLSMTQCPQFEVERNEMDFVPYVNAIGSLMYAMVCSRLDIAHSVSVLSRFMANLGREHWNGFKWLLRYVRGSLGVGLKFGSSKEGVGIIGYVDLDYAGDLDKRRSTTGYIFILFGGPVSSKSQLQSIAALSTTEAEYIVATEAMKEPLWLQGLVKELGVDVRYHFIRETISSGAAKLEKISTPDNPANMATKVLLVSKFKYCMDLYRQEVTKNQKNVTCMMIDSSFEWMMMKLRKKVLTFRGIINFPSCDKVGPINEVYF